MVFFSLLCTCQVFYNKNAWGWGNSVIKEVTFVIAARSTELCPDGLSRYETHMASRPPWSSYYVRNLFPRILVPNPVIA